MASTHSGSSEGECQAEELQAAGQDTPGMRLAKQRKTEQLSPQTAAMRIEVPTKSYGI